MPGTRLQVYQVSCARDQVARDHVSGFRDQVPRQNVKIFTLKVFYVLTEIAKLTNILFTKLVSAMHVVVLHLWAKTLKNTGGNHL